MSDLDKELAAQREEQDERWKMTFYNSWKIDAKGTSLLSFPYPDVLEDFAQKADERKLATKVLIFRTPDNKQHVFPDYNIFLFLFYDTSHWITRVVGLRDFWRLRREGEPAVLYRVESGKYFDRDRTHLWWVRYEGKNYSVGHEEKWGDRQSFVKACAATLIRPVR